MSVQRIYTIRPIKENVRLGIIFSVLVTIILIVLGSFKNNQIELGIFFRLFVIMPLTLCIAYWYQNSSIYVGKSEYVYKSFKSRHCVMYKDIERVVILESIENNEASYALMIKANEVYTIPNIEIYCKEEIVRFIECLTEHSGLADNGSSDLATIIESLDMIKWASK